METKEFLSAVYEVIRLNYPANDPDGLSAARVGVLIRRAFPGLSWESFGFPKLKHMLASLEAQGLIKTGLNSKSAFTIRLTNNVTTADHTVPAPTHPSPREFLRKDVWNAFVLNLPRGRRFLDRHNGSVRMAATEIPDASGNWIEVEPIPQDAQKSWAQGFLQSYQLLSDANLSAALGTDDWYRYLRNDLARRDPALLTSWNRVRTQNVVAHVREWCQGKNIPEHLVFESSRRIETPKTVSSSPTNVQSIRSAILNAVSQMSLDELLEIRIPARHLVTQLFPGGVGEVESV